MKGINLGRQGSPYIAVQEPGMEPKLRRKTYKVEIEITVEVDEVGAEHLAPGIPVETLPTLSRFQAAALEDPNASLSLELAAIAARLQDYADLLAKRDTLPALRELAASLSPEDCEILEATGSDFSDATRPLRTGCISVHLDGSRILEATGSAGKAAAWNEVWKDLLPVTELGKGLRRLSVPASRLDLHTGDPEEHFLLLRGLFQQLGVVRLEAVCSCGEALSGASASEEQAVEGLWESFRKHREKASFRKHLLRGWRSSLDPSIWLS